MQLTREADYALRTMLEVATQPFGELTTTTQVSRHRLVPLPFVRKIVPRLAAAGLLRTRRGKSGGLMLARQPDEISLLAVIDAVSADTITINRCVLQPETCPLQPICPVHEVCRVVRDEMVRLFGSVRLSDMVTRGAELKARQAARARESRVISRPRATVSDAGGVPPARAGGGAPLALSIRAPR
ncbi:MAG: Rrf2 family transcriptional regulator [Chloroflexi bacterium]|nr:Rrf2 family transcriptional regulator [Chloroflexota bacterium]